MNEYVPVWTFILLVGGQFATAIWFIATLKAKVGSLADKVNKLDDTLQKMMQYETRIALIEQSLIAAHKRIDDVHRVTYPPGQRLP